MKRFFGLREKIALFLAADGKCENCGDDLPAGWHADHVKPWSRGGVTNVVNGQALCAACNLRKGNNEMMKFEGLRRWQKRFVQSFSAWTEATYLLVALPGGGKTIAALFAAKEWMDRAEFRQRFIVVVAPSRNLKRQWRNTAKRLFSIELQTMEFSGALKTGMHGCVVTYNAIASEPMLFARLCAKHEVLVVFDEVHHVGDSAAWGNGVREAFENATKRLAMSGTPWRSDGGQIPFLKPNEETGGYEHQECFDWPQALTDDPPAIRYLSFRPYHGFAEYEQGGAVIRLSSRDTLSDDDVARCLRGRILEQRFVTDVLREAHAKLMRLRESKPDAGGIVVCIDITHAQKVAKWLKEVTGEEPVIAVSDDEVSPGEPVEQFGAQGATAKWIVSVRQVSEGVDIPRLMVGVYLTNYTTELFFRQFIGRVARNQGTEQDREAYVFMPHHPRLVEYAEKIQELQAVALAKKSSDEKPTNGGDTAERGPSSFTFLGASDAESAGMILPGLLSDTQYAPTEARTISDFSSKYAIPETTAARIIRDFAQRQSAEAEPGADFDDGLPLEERLEIERKRQSKRIAYLAVLTSKDHKTLNGEANRHAGCATIDIATEEQLSRRRLYIERRIKEAKDAA